MLVPQTLRERLHRDIGAPMQAEFRVELSLCPLNGLLMYTLQNLMQSSAFSLQIEG